MADIDLYCDECGAQFIPDDDTCLILQPPLLCPQCFDELDRDPETQAPAWWRNTLPRLDLA
jgi:hypothetical protein